MNTREVDDAVRRFSEGSSCAQAILAAFGPLVGVESGLAHKMGAGLGAGVGRKQYLCGAVNAGAIILSLKYGSADHADAGARERSYGAVGDFITAIESELGSSDCFELMGVLLDTPEDRQEARSKGLFDTVCKNCVRTVAEYLARELDTNTRL